MKRATPPAVIVAFGIFTIVTFGTVVTYLTGKTPVLQLKPALEKHYGARPFTTKFVANAAAEPHIEVVTPAAIASDVLALRAVGVKAIEEYLKLAPSTQITYVVVEGPKTRVPPLLPQTVFREQLGRDHSVRLSLDAFSRWVQQETMRTPLRLSVVAPGVTGSVVEIVLGPGDGDEAALCDRIARVILKRAPVSLLLLKMEGAATSGKTRGYGPDLAELAPHLVPPPPPRPPAPPPAPPVAPRAPAPAAPRGSP